MFSSVGWGEFLLVLVVAFLIIGPERLPGVIKEFKAIRLAVKTAMNDARKQLDGELGDELREFSEPLKEFSEPIRQLNSYRTMSPKAFIAKTLLDDDTSDIDAAEEAAREAIGKPLSTMRTTTPKRAIQDYFSQPPASSQAGAQSSQAQPAHNTGSQAAQASPASPNQGAASGTTAGPGTNSATPPASPNTDNAQKTWDNLDDII